VAEVVGSGEAYVAVHQISEIVPDTTYTAGLGAAVLDATAARALIALAAIASNTA